MNKIFCSILLSLFSLHAVSGIAVIVHPDNGDSLDKKSISNLYLGKTKKFPGGAQAIPINLEERQVNRGEFDSTVLGKSSSQLKSYWSKKVFTGKGTPPKEFANDDEVIKLVSSNPNIIGYIDSSKVNDTVKVVAEF
ncbi:phosphate ABC transporter substrate-binding protein [Shewanella psychropiezotolerans]|uniref:Phosphate ABC transporter substrate-binding protein n=1 Tax=Shewanella psychropiezotolerans TaxID=2593655 RepID=A0ABX5WUU1_9GAMM|nr:MULTISPECIES: phosphate ABC transporter substrate-binding protein [Shewanella]MPY23244.1 phosphate ABC transporter substrate-binding protein [Shewanella sp. YLB-07]QDO82865.1 phosphate ABC transporter substrate-binding protein [Shewanella psychropiezotolerans]